MVRAIPGARPRVFHASFEIAETEAMRIALILPTANVYVLESVLRIKPIAIAALPTTPTTETPQEKKAPVVIIKKTRKAIL